MLYLLFGQDSFRVKEKLNQIKEKFREQTGSDLNIENFDETVSASKIKDIFQFSSFFNLNRLIIFKDFINKASTEAQKELLKFLAALSQDLYVVFVETQEKAKNPIWKLVAQKGKIWRFEPLKFYELNNWARRRFLAKGGIANQEAIRTLTFYVGNNLWRLDSEIDKSVAYKGRKEITDEDVRALVKPEFSPGIFDLIDYLAVKDLKKTQQTLRSLLLSGENPLYIHTMIVYQFRNLILVKYLSERGAQSSEIREKTAIHPYVIQKSLNQIKKFSLNDLKKIYSKLMDAEIAMKTGKIEADLALELLVVGLIG